MIGLVLPNLNRTKHFLWLSIMQVLATLQETLIFK